MSDRSEEEKRVFKEGEPTERVHLWIYSADIRWIDANIDKVKRSKFIRLCVRRIVRSIQAKAEDDSKTIVPPDMEGDEE